MKIQKTKKSEKQNQNQKITSSRKHDAAVGYIKAAIDALGESAISGDTVAKESIANLSVVLFDLK